MLKKHLYLLIFCLAFSLAFYCAYLYVSSTTSDKAVYTPVSMTQPISALTSYPVFNGTNAKSACLIDAKSNEVLYSHNSNMRLPMASTTKIMTALTALDYLSPTDIVTVPKSAVGIEGSSIYLTENEKITVETLLYGLLLNSGNDAASALAAVSLGNTEKFAQAMNKKAHSLGLIDTNFTNPHGLHDENHYTTSYELGLITSYALKNPHIAKIVSTKKHTVSANGLSTARFFSNHNKLLSYYDGCIGVKTGFTKAAGRCLVSAAQRDDEIYIAVTLNDASDWKDHSDMLDFAFENFESVEIASRDSFAVYIDGKAYIPKESIYLTAIKDTKTPNISYKISKESSAHVITYFLDGNRSGRFTLEEKTA